MKVKNLTVLMFSSQTNIKCKFLLAAWLAPFNHISSTKSNNSCPRRATVFRYSYMLQMRLLFICSYARGFDVACVLRCAGYGTEWRGFEESLDFTKPLIYLKRIHYSKSLDVQMTLLD